MLCANIVGRRVALGVCTGHLFVYSIDALLDALERADAARAPRRACTAPAEMDMQATDPQTCANLRKHISVHCLGVMAGRWTN